MSNNPLFSPEVEAKLYQTLTEGSGSLRNYNTPSVNPATYEKVATFVVKTLLPLVALTAKPEEVREVFFKSAREQPAQSFSDLIHASIVCLNILIDEALKPQSDLDLFLQQIILQDARVRVSQTYNLFATGSQT